MLTKGSHHHKQIWLLTFCLLGASLFLCLLGFNSRAKAENLFINYGFYFVMVVFIWWVMDLCSFLKDKKEKFLQEKKRLWISLLIGFVLSGVVFLSCDIGFKVNSDETNLLTVSKSLAVDKKVHNTFMGKNYFGNFRGVGAVIPKRPLMFPFLTSLFHSVFGFSPLAPFMLNFLILMMSLFLYVFIVSYFSNYIFGLATAILFISNPIVSISSTSAGFDMASIFFFMLSILALFLFIKEDNHFSLFLSTLAMFCNIRYESILIAFVIVCFAFFRKKIWPSALHWMFLSLFGLMMVVPYFWQIILSKGNYENPAGVDVFSFINFKKNVLLFVTALGSFSFKLPYPTILLLFGLIAMAAIFYLAIKKKICIKNEIIVPICIALGLVIFLSHHAGNMQLPTQARFFIPFSVFCITALVFLIVKMKRHVSSYLFLFFSVMIFVLYHPIATEGRFMNRLFLKRELNVVYDFLQQKERDKNILILHRRPGQFTALGYGAVTLEYAQQNWEVLMEELHRRLFQKILLIERIEYKKTKDTWFSTRSDIKELKIFQVKRDAYIRISEIVRP